MREGLLVKMVNLNIFLFCVMMIFLIVEKSNADISTATCVGTDTCTSLPNAECTGTSGSETCTCKANTNMVNNVCVLPLEGNCAGGLTCTTPNAECSENKCSCEIGYVANNDACDQVLTEIDCSTNGNSDCTVENSVCGTNAKCQCEAGFVLQDNKCVTVLTDIDCSANGDDDCTAENSVCGNNDKCQCDVGFLLQGNKCETESGAASTKAITWMVFSSLLILLVNKLMM